MTPSAANEGVTREQIQEWMNIGLNAVENRLPDAENIEGRMRQQRITLAGLIGKHCPPLARHCSDLLPLQRQIDGLLSLQEEETASRDEHRILQRIRKEYRTVTTRIRKIFAGKGTVTAPPSTVDRQKPTIFTFEQFEATWDRVIRPLADRIRISPNSMDGLEEKEKLMAAFKESVAVETLRIGLQYLYLDLPRPRIDSLLYLRHFRQGMERLFDQLDIILEGVHESFASTHRRVYMQGMEAVEREVTSNYALPDEDEFAKPLIWASDFHRTENEAFEECHQLDYDLQQEIDAFFDSPAGRAFAPKNDRMMLKQKTISRKLLGRVSREQYRQFEREWEEWFQEFNQLVEQEVVPQMGGRLASLIRENVGRARVLTAQRVEALFVRAEESMKQHNDGLQVAAEGGPEARETFELQPIIAKNILFAVCRRLNEIGKISDENDRGFLQLMRTDMNYARRYSQACATFNVTQNLLIRSLPDPVDLGAFRDFMAQMRAAFLKFERVMLVRNVGPIQTIRVSYLEGFDRMEREVGEIFALQLPQKQAEAKTPPRRTLLGRLRGLFRPTPASEMEAQPEEHEGVPLEEVWEELHAANKKGDEIYDAAMRKIGIEPQRDEGGFERMIHDAVVRLCPDPVTSLADLEGIIYWLIGRIQAIEVIIPGKPEQKTNWPREINRRQFAAALHRICARLPQKPSLEVRGLLTRPLEVSQEDPENAEIEISRYDLLKDISTGLQRAEVRIIGAIGKKTQMTHRQKILQRYFARVQRAMETYMQDFCPEVIRTPAPVVGLDSYLSEISYCSRFWLHEAGSDSEDEWHDVRLKIDEAFVPVLEWSEMLLHSKSVDVDSFLAVDVGKIRTDGQEARSEVPPRSATLAGTPPPEFAAALADSSLLDANFLWKQINEGCRAAERALPEALRIAPAERETLVRLIWRFRQLGYALAEQVTAEGPIRTVEAYEQCFAVLGALIDKMQDKYHGKLHEFLAEHFRNTRTNIEARVCHERAQKEMAEAVAELPKPPQMPSQYAEFFNRYARNLLATFCRQFFYSCITPDLDRNSVRGIGIAVDTTTEVLAADLGERINILCRTARHGIPTLPELRQCVRDFVAGVDITGLSISSETEDRFRHQVLDQLVQAVTGCTHPRDLFQAHPQPSPTAVLDGALEQETEVVLEVREDERLAAMLQAARGDLQTSHDYLHAMADVAHVLERADENHQALVRLTQAIQGIRGTLFGEYETASAAQVSDDGLHPRIEPLMVILQNVRRAVFDPSDPERQRRSINALQQLTDIIRGLHRSLPRPV